MIQCRRGSRIFLDGGHKKTEHTRVQPHSIAHTLWGTLISKDRLAGYYCLYCSSLLPLPHNYLYVRTCTHTASAKREALYGVGFGARLRAPKKNLILDGLWCNVRRFPANFIQLFKQMFSRLYREYIYQLTIFLCRLIQLDTTKV